MASRYKDRQPAPGCTSEVERLAQAQQRDRRYAGPSVRVKAQGVRTSPRRPWKSETRVSQPFRRAKAYKCVLVNPALEPKIVVALANIEAHIAGAKVARAEAVSQIVFAPFRSTARERIAAHCNLAS